MAKLQTLKPRLANAPATRVRTVEVVSWRMDKRASAERGYGHKWRKARESFLAEHPLCEYCEREGRVTAATVVDHKTPHRGDEQLFWDRTNWQALCAPCHSSVKQREEAQGA